MNVFEKYGLKEVADVHFIAVEDDDARNIKQGDIVLFLDTLKIANVAIDSEEVKYSGGYGGSTILSWNCNKNVKMDLQDATMSMESLGVFLGAKVEEPSAVNPMIQHMSDLCYWPTDLPNHDYMWISVNSGRKGKHVANEGAPAINDFPVRIFWEKTITVASQAQGLTIDTQSFPGIYKIVGNSKVRNTKGKDRDIQLIIPNAKLMPNTSIPLSSDGEQAMFDMSIQALARDGSELLHLIIYQDIDQKDFQFYIDVRRGELVFRHPEITIAMALDGEHLEFYDVSDPPYGSYVFELQDDELLFKEE